MIESRGLVMIEPAETRPRKEKRRPTVVLEIIMFVGFFSCMSFFFLVGEPEGGKLAVCIYIPYIYIYLG